MKDATESRLSVPSVASSSFYLGKGFVQTFSKRLTGVKATKKVAVKKFTPEPLQLLEDSVPQNFSIRSFFEEEVKSSKIN